MGVWGSGGHGVSSGKEEYENPKRKGNSQIGPIHMAPRDIRSPSLSPEMVISSNRTNIHDALICTTKPERTRPVLDADLSIFRVEPEAIQCPALTWWLVPPDPAIV